MKKEEKSMRSEGGAIGAVLTHRSGSSRGRGEASGYRVESSDHRGASPGRRDGSSGGRDSSKGYASESGRGRNQEVEREKRSFSKVAPKKVGKLDMVIAFDTTGSMAQYIEAVRREVSELIPQLFRDNEDLRLGIVAFGDYCDMDNAREFGDAYQCIQPTDNENALVKFVLESQDTSGGDGPEFYELVIKKIVEETPWRRGSTRSILLIADAVPHELGYTYGDYVVDNRIDWRREARKAAHRRIKIDTVTIEDYSWFKELSAMTNGVSVPFKTGHKTAELVRASVMSRGSVKARLHFDVLMESCKDKEMRGVYESYRREREECD